MSALACALAILAGPGLRAADLALVIDDVGYNKERGERAIALPGNITIAVLPFTPHAQPLASAASAMGKDVIIHQPMEPFPSAHARTEHGTLTLTMPGHEFDALVVRALDTIPERVGMSNHTGSLLTQHREPMQRLMRTLSERGLYFLDSRTSSSTVAMQVAREMGVPSVRRDVFLDHDKNPAAIAAAFNQAVRIARYHGRAVLVGHPYPETLDFLEHRLTDLPSDVRLVSAYWLAKRASLELAGVEAATGEAGSATPARHLAMPAQPLDQARPHISLGR